MQRAEGIAGAPHDATTPPAVAPGHGRRVAEPSPARGTGLTLKIPLLSPKKPPHTSERHLAPQKATSTPKKPPRLPKKPPRPPQKATLPPSSPGPGCTHPTGSCSGWFLPTNFFKKIALKT